MQTFFESTLGQVSVIASIILSFALILFFSKEDDKQNVKAVTYSAIAVALAFTLNQITLFRMPQGGSVTPLSMMFIVLVGYIFGLRQGLLAGIAFGLLDLLINPYVIHPAQMILDYPLAFGALAIGAIFRNRSLIATYLVGVFGRFTCSFFSGIIFFSAFAPESQGAVLYSIVYNGSYMLTEAIITCIVLMLPPVRKAIERIKNESNVGIIKN